MASQKLSQELYSLVLALKRVLRERASKISQRPLWTFPLAYVETMCFIGQKRVVGMKELADYLRIKPPSATVLIKQMLKAKLIERDQTIHDRRAVLIKLSALGKRVVKKKAVVVDQTINRLFSVLTLQEKKTLIKILRKTINNL